MADETYDDARERLRAERRETEQRLAGLTGSFTDIDLGTLDPFQQCLRHTANLGGD